MRPTDSLASPRYHSFSSHWVWSRSAFSCSSFTRSEISTLMVRTSASVTAQTFVMARLSFLPVGWSERTGARELGDGTDDSEASSGSRGAEAWSVASYRASPSDRRRYGRRTTPHRGTDDGRDTIAKAEDGLTTWNASHSSDQPGHAVSSLDLSVVEDHSPGRRRGTRYFQVKVVPKGGLEPPRVAPHAPQTCASASSATSAKCVEKYTVSPIEGQTAQQPDVAAD